MKHPHRSVTDNEQADIFFRNYTVSRKLDHFRFNQKPSGNGLTLHHVTTTDYYLIMIQKFNEYI